MRKRDYQRDALRRFKRIADETDAKVLRAIADGIARLEREKLEYQLRQQRRKKLKL